MKELKMQAQKEQDKPTCPNNNTFQILLHSDNQSSPLHGHCSKKNKVGFDDSLFELKITFIILIMLNEISRLISIFSDQICKY